jgi:hypothetical protein
VVTYDTVRELARQLPGVEEGTSYGTAALKVQGKLLVRLKEDGDTIVLRTDFIEREDLLRTAPKTFFLTDHYRDYPSVLVRLPHVGRGQLAELLEDAWRRLASKKLIASYEARRVKA